MRKNEQRLKLTNRITGLAAGVPGIAERSLRRDEVSSGRSPAVSRVADDTVDPVHVFGRQGRDIRPRAAKLLEKLVEAASFRVPFARGDGPMFLDRNGALLIEFNRRPLAFGQDGPR
jgi:hypothetical protein